MKYVKWNDNASELASLFEAAAKDLREGIHPSVPRLMKAVRGQCNASNAVWVAEIAESIAGVSEGDWEEVLNRESLRKKNK